MKAYRMIDAYIAEVELSQGYWACVDVVSLPLLTKYNWSVLRTKGQIYAKTRIAGRTVYMHRLVADAPPDPKLVIDH
jgi:hypothetical protein